jgi:hypothetical protein
MACFVLNQANIFPSTTQTLYSPTSITNIFNLTTFSILASGGIGIGILAIITKAYTYASLIAIIWAVGIFIPILSDFLLAFPRFMNAILPVELQYLTLVFSAYAAMMFFMFIMQLVTQRSVET